MTLALPSRAIASLVSIVILAWLSAACSSSRSNRRSYDLPYHVAVSPVSVMQVDASDESNGALVQLGFDAAEFQSALVEQVNVGVFTAVTPLSSPQGASEGDFTSLPFEDQTQRWAQMASQAGADLLLRPRLRYSSHVDSRPSMTTFLLNIPVFLFLGPASYWVDDRRYDTVARLEIDVFDVTRLDPDGQLRSSQLLRSARSEFRGATYDYTKRVGATYEYLYTVIVPPGLLSVKNDKVAAALQRDATASLCRNAVEELVEDCSQLLMPDSGGQFFVPPHGLSVTAYADGSIHLRGEVLQDSVASSVSELRTFDIFVGDYVFEGRFEDLPGRPDSAPAGFDRQRLLRYAIDARLDGAGPMQGRPLVRVEVADGVPLGGRSNRRSFSFAVQASAEATCPRAATAIPAHYRGSAKPIEANSSRSR